MITVLNLKEKVVPNLQSFLLGLQRPLLEKANMPAIYYLNLNKIDFLMFHCMTDLMKLEID